MLSLKELFKRDALDNQGKELSKIIRQKMLRSDAVCLIDFAGIANVTPHFFQELIFPLIIEFGSHDLDNKLKLNNLNDQHLVAYRLAADQVGDYMDKLSFSQKSPFGELSDITFELLLKARDLSRTDPEATQTVFGFNSDMAESFAAMDIETIRRISNSGVVCFELRLSPEFATQLAALDPSEIDVFLNIVGGLDDIYEHGYA
jgi:hypothetical protein